MFKRAVLLPLLLALTACGVNLPNLAPTPLEEVLVPETNDLGLGRILALQVEQHQLAQEIYEERAQGSDYSPQMRDRLKALISLNRTISKKVAALHQACMHEPQALAQACHAYTRAAFKTAEMSEELYGLLLGYTYAGLEKNPAFLTKQNEELANKLMLEQRQMKEAEAEPLRKFAGTLHMGTGGAFVSQESNVCTSPSVVFSGTANEELANAIREESTSSVLSSYPDITLTLITSQLDFQTSGDQAIRVGAIALFMIPVAGLPGSGGDATIAASVSQNGNKPIKLALNTYLINARDSNILLGLVASRIVGAAHFALLREKIV